MTERNADNQLPVGVTDRIDKRIFFVRKHRVMLSTDLAELYGVEPRALIQAVKRNIERFPDDFMFQLTEVEFADLKSQFVTSSWGGMRRALPYAFTEQGVAMLSSVLRSRQAVRVNVEIIRAFVRLRRILASHADLDRKLEELERKYDAQFRVVNDAIRQLMRKPPPEPEKPRKIGFHVRETLAEYDPGPDPKNGMRKARLKRRDKRWLLGKLGELHGRAAGCVKFTCLALTRAVPAPLLRGFRPFFYSAFCTPHSALDSP